MLLYTLIDKAHGTVCLFKHTKCGKNDQLERKRKKLKYQHVSIRDAYNLFSLLSFLLFFCFLLFLKMVLFSGYIYIYIILYFSILSEACIFKQAKGPIFPFVFACLSVTRGKKKKRKTLSGHW